ncbi:MAG: hypothetical protein J3K34DRAFT_409201 [Monoraphidium minutum]|nr:MAG: hypothetical protein J3K34DRAFT_409201 [Monoraphidium minutum]
MGPRGLDALVGARWLPGLTALTFDSNPLAACIGDFARLDLRGLRHFVFDDHDGPRADDQQAIALAAAPRRGWRS